MQLFLFNKLFPFKSRKQNLRPHFGNMYFMEDVHKLEFSSKPGEKEENEKVKTKKIIELTGAVIQVK